MFDGLKKLTQKLPGNRLRLVDVIFCDLSATPDMTRRHYAYIWTLPEEPQVGWRVMVEGYDGRDAATVIAAVDVARPRDVSVAELAKTRRFPTRAEVSGAADDLTAWLDMGRRAAGLPTPGRARRKPPAGYQEIPPASGATDPQSAGTYGGVWWSLMREAERAGRPKDEIKAFRVIAQGWYAIRDQGR